MHVDFYLLPLLKKKRKTDCRQAFKLGGAGGGDWVGGPTEKEANHQRGASTVRSRRGWNFKFFNCRRYMRNMQRRVTGVIL